MAEAVSARGLQEANERLHNAIDDAVKKVSSLGVYKNLKESVYGEQLTLAKMSLQFTKFHNRANNKQEELLHALVFRLVEAGVSRLEL